MSNRPSTEQTVPQPLPLDENREEGAEVLYEGRDLEVLADLPNYYNWIIDTFRPKLRGHVMEIGAGIGTISKRIISSVDRLILVEPSENLSKFLPPSLKDNPKVSTFTDTLEAHLPQVADMSLDAIVMVNVLEHVEDDNTALKELFRALKPDGHLLLFVPALQFLYSDIDQIHGHFRRYHKKPLEKQLLDSGFYIHHSRYFDIAGVFPWWLINKVCKKTDFAPGPVAFYDRYIIPVTRFIEGLIPPPLGKNIIIIASRPPEASTD